MRAAAIRANLGVPKIACPFGIRMDRPFGHQVFRIRNNSGLEAGIFPDDK